MSKFFLLQCIFFFKGREGGGKECGYFEIRRDHLNIRGVNDKKSSWVPQIIIYSYISCTFA